MASDASHDLDGRTFDAIVVGAGFGGLGAALALGERGARVLVCETLGYPGGCASTFSRDGYRFESGATLFSGLGEGQLFRRWIDRHGLDVEVTWLDPVVELRAPGMTLAVPSDRTSLVERLSAFEGAPRAHIERFFDRQRRVAAALWPLLDRPELLPPFGLDALVRHVRSSPGYARLLPLIGRPLLDVVRADGLAAFAPLRTYLDAVCRITLHVSAAEAEAPFALSVLDYFARGTGHVRGGIGRLADALVAAIRATGGQVALATRVRRLERSDGLWRVATRRGTARAPLVVANLVPQALTALLEDAGEASRRLAPLTRRVESGFGAAMLYRVVRAPAGASPDARHLQLVHRGHEPFVEGNHVFCSIGEAELDAAPRALEATRARRRAVPGERLEPGADLRTMTVSTHVPMARLRALDARGRAAYVAWIQERMRRTLALRAPEWSEVVHELTASPRTFERFTGRPAGYVGGVPRRAGLGAYRGLVRGAVLEGLHLVGDSVFPGQSTLAAAAGGVKLAERLAS